MLAYYLSLLEFLGLHFKWHILYVQSEDLMHSQGQCHESFLQDGEGFSRYHLQRVALIRLPFGPTGSDVSPGHSNVPPGVDHEASFVTDPALCD